LRSSAYGLRLAIRFPRLMTQKKLIRNKVRARSTGSRSNTLLRWAVTVVALTGIGLFWLVLPALASTNAF
jgi:hypothetical protein